jgi:hypothetical protein
MQTVDSAQTVNSLHQPPALVVRPLVRRQAGMHVAVFNGQQSGFLSSATSAAKVRVTQQVDLPLARRTNVEAPQLCGIPQKDTTSAGMSCHAGI